MKRQLLRLTFSNRGTLTPELEIVSVRLPSLLLLFQFSSPESKPSSPNFRLIHWKSYINLVYILTKTKITAGIADSQALYNFLQEIILTMPYGTGSFA